jgi:hypothetical protein
MLEQMSLRIPDYMMDDKSYVSIYETQSSLQSSLASSSFSEFDVSMSAYAKLQVCKGSHMLIKVQIWQLLRLFCRRISQLWRVF